MLPRPSPRHVAIPASMNHGDSFKTIALQKLLFLCCSNASGNETSYSIKEQCSTHISFVHGIKRF